jgi:hypothetical protein
MTPYLILVAVVVIALFGFWRMIVGSDNIHAQLRVFKREAEEAKNTNELVEIYGRLREFHSEKCWHRHHGNHANEVASYIAGRLNGV